MAKSLGVNYSLKFKCKYQEVEVVTYILQVFGHLIIL